MKKCIGVLIFLMLLTTTVCFNNKIKAATDYRLSTAFPSTIKSKRSDLIKYNTISIYKKTYNNDTGKALCTGFILNASDGATCTATYWNSNANTNKKIAVGVGAIINKARSLSGSTTGGIDGWDYYFYAEMAINQFLYSYNGKKNMNNISAHVISGWSGVTNNSTYKALYSAGTSAYNNYGKSSVTLSKPTFAVGSDNKTVTATVKVTCKNTSGSTSSCNLTTTSLLVSGTDEDGNSVSQTLSPSKTSKSNNIVTLTYTKTFNKSFKTGSNVKGSFSVKNKVSYGISQNYNCGSYQPLTPNLVKTMYLYDTDSVSKSSGTTNCSITINKKDDNSNALRGATFYLYSDAAGKEKIDTAVSNANGVVSFTGLAAGTYYYKEVIAPSGYNLDSSLKPINVTDSSGACNASATVTNTKKTSNLTINKVDLDGKPVSGAKIKVYLITNNPDYEEDDYTSEGTETTLPSVVDDEEFGSDYTEIDEGKYIYTYLYFDANGNYVPGITSNEDGKYYDYFITSDSAKTITGLTADQVYYVIEDSLPRDTDYAAKVREDMVLIDEGGKTYVTTLVNDHSNISISKQDITTKKELPGAQLQIQDSRGITIQSWISTDKSQEITGLPDGDYTLTETTAPNGYNVSESIPFTIENGKLKDDADNTLVMYDSVVVDVPDTFSTKNIITMLIGLFMVSIGTYILVYEFKKNKTA